MVCHDLGANKVQMGDSEYCTFVFDHVFYSASTQAEIFECVGKPIVEDVLAGYNGTVLAYGQTGSGKTHSMMGVLGDPEQEGLIPRSSSLIFQSILSDEAGTEFTIKISMLEIYKEALKDLLYVSEEKLKIKETAEGISVTGLTEEYVGSEQELMDRIEFGQENRTVACTKMNSRSSRSHQLFIIKVHQCCEDGVQKVGTLNLVDLAGSEKISASGVKGLGLEEAKKINLSLSMLGHVIHQLSQGASHIPYRDSKLTRLLQESLGGNFKTRLLVACSPHIRNLEESISTLKFAQRAKTVKTKAKMNLKEAPDVVIARLTKQLEEAFAYIEELKRMLAKNGDIPINIITVQSELQLSQTDFQPEESPETSQTDRPKPENSAQDLPTEAEIDPPSSALPGRVYTKPKGRSFTHFQRRFHPNSPTAFQPAPNFPESNFLHLHQVPNSDTLASNSDLFSGFPALTGTNSLANLQFPAFQAISPQLDVIPDIAEEDSGRFAEIGEIQRSWEALRRQYSLHLREFQRQIEDLKAQKLSLKQKNSLLREQNQSLEQFIMTHLDLCHQKRQGKGVFSEGVDREQETAVLKREVRGLTQRLLDAENRAAVAGEQKQPNWMEMEEIISCDSSFVTIIQATEVFNDVKSTPSYSIMHTLPIDTEYLATLSASEAADPSFQLTNQIAQ